MEIQISYFLSGASPGVYACAQRILTRQELIVQTRHPELEMGASPILYK